MNTEVMESSVTPKSYLEILQEWQEGRDPKGTALRMKEYMELMRLLNMSFEGGMSLIVDDLAERCLRIVAKIGVTVSPNASLDEIAALKLQLDCLDVYNLLVMTEITMTLVEMLIAAECVSPGNIDSARFQVFSKRNEIPEHLVKWAKMYVVPKGV